jgi:hypothetical protein
VQLDKERKQKEEIRMLLFADNMIFYVENLLKSQEKNYCN